ncbi:MAG: hypothetical protein Q7R96_02020 [Nanoarchaeota archaeon]|nr:hypothetical protein [Nanoarchaeota archaeon]
MLISRIKNDYPGLHVLLQQNFLEKKEIAIHVCRSCSHPNNTSEIKTIKNLWKCVNCDRNNKYDQKTEKIKKFYQVDLKKLKEGIRNHLKNNKLITENIDEDDYVVLQGKKIPVLILELNSNTSSLIEWLSHSCFILYLYDESKNKIADIYSKPSFFRLTDFFQMNEQKLNDCFRQISLKYEESDIMKITDKLSNYIVTKEWNDFEKEISTFFNNFKNHEQKLKDMLAFLKKNKENPTGTKFVCISGNFPVDIMPIILYQYIDELLKTEQNKGYDTKFYSNKITKSVINKKCNTNKGRKLIFVTNNFADNGAWEEIIKAKKNNGEWYHFILDLDLLKMLLYFVGYDQYFN